MGLSHGFWQLSNRVLILRFLHLNHYERNFRYILQVCFVEQTSWLLAKHLYFRTKLSICFQAISGRVRLSADISLFVCLYFFALCFVFSFSPKYKHISYSKCKQCVQAARKMFSMSVLMTINVAAVKSDVQTHIGDS